jgi:hypothetical protein
MKTGSRWWMEYRSRTAPPERLKNQKERGITLVFRRSEATH